MAGDLLTLADGTKAAIEKIWYEKLTAPVLVYNFEVADFHTYYVGNSKVLVHNTCNKTGNTDEVGLGGNQSVVTGEKASQIVAKNKTGPKPAGTGAHNLKIAEVASQVKDGKIIAGGGQKSEVLIDTAGGYKSGRRPDILVERPDGSQYGINVGKTTVAGAPITREAQAISDLEGAGYSMYYVPYD